MRIWFKEFKTWKNTLAFTNFKLKVPPPPWIIYIDLLCWYRSKHVGAGGKKWLVKNLINGTIFFRFAIKNPTGLCTQRLALFYHKTELVLGRKSNLVRSENGTVVFFWYGASKRFSIKKNRWLWCCVFLSSNRGKVFKTNSCPLQFIRKKTIIYRDPILGMFFIVI